MRARAPRWPPKPLAVEEEVLEEETGCELLDKTTNLGTGAVPQLSGLKGPPGEGSGGAQEAVPGVVSEFACSSR